MPAGSGGQIAIFSTTSLYADVTSAALSAALWTNFVSESVEHKFDELVEGAITGYKATPPSHQGADMANGDISLEPNPNAIGMFLRGVFGQSSGSLLTHAGSWGANSGGLLNLPPGYSARPVITHTFLPSQSAYDPYTYLPPYGIFLYKDVGSAFVHTGAIFNTLNFQIQAGQLVKSTVGVMARNTTRHARITSVAALRNPGGQPWVWNAASVQVGPGVSSLAAYTYFESIDVKYETPIEGVLLLDGTRKYGEMQVNGFQSVNISGTMAFRDQTEYDQFVSYTNRFLRLTLRNTNSSQIIGNPSSAYYFGLDIDIPQFKILTWQTNISGPNRLTAQFTAKGEFDVTSLYNIEVRLINTTSAYI